MTHNARQPSKAAALFLLSAMVALGVFPMDVMLPSYPALASAFGMDIHEVTLFLATFTMGFAISQIVIGPLSDKYGRPIMLKIGLIISLTGITGCLFSNSQLSFAAARLIQGIGCGCFVLAQAIVQDAFTAEDRQKIRIYLLSLGGICISFSPLLGTYLQHLFNWQGSFYVFAVLALVVLAQAVFFFPATQNQTTTQRSQKLDIVGRYTEVLGSRPFVCSWLTSALAFSSHFGFIAISPIIFLDVLKVSSLTYSFVLMGYGGAYVMGGLLATRLSKTLAVDAQINLGLAITALAGLVMTGMMTYQLSIAAVVIPMIMCTLGTTLIRPAASSRAMGMFSEKAGTSSAAGGTIVFVTAGLVSMLLSYAPLPPLESLSGFILIASLLGYGANKWGVAEGKVLVDVSSQ